MAEFREIKTAVQKQFEVMSQGELFRVNLTRDDAWELYLKSFPPGSNSMYRTRTEYDCSCCRQFVKDVGNVVAIVDNQMISIWDVPVPEPYLTVVRAMSRAVKDSHVVDVFRHREAHAGTDKSRELHDVGGNNHVVQTWEHFYIKLPTRFVSKDPGSVLNEFRTNKEVFKRGLHEITMESGNVVLELIGQNSLYRGEEHKAVVELFLKHKRFFTFFGNDKGLEAQDLYCWKKSVRMGSAARIRNTVIGTLLTDLSEGVDLTKAVKSFEDKVAPANYKRPSALITKGMIKKAQETVESLGLTASLPRRHAVTRDITVNNVLFADREARKEMNAFERLAATTTEKGNFDKVEEVEVLTFISAILPKADKIELFVENKHSSNLMSLVAPEDPDSKLLFKWANNFSWAYNGEVTDSIKERVKTAGGNVTGVLRYSLSWLNTDDLDAWVKEPDGSKIGYPNARHVHPSTGVLDVDMNVSPTTRTPVENITWSDRRRMQEGIYTIWVNQYNSRNTSDLGFDAELEYDGQIYSFHYPKKQRTGESVVVAKFKYTRAKGVEIIESLPSSQSSKTVWEIPTQTFRKVSMIMHSPNHWDDRTVGNKHWFFMLDGCKNEKPARGFFNEFLNQDLNEHRKVFEVLGSKMKCAESDEQLSGLGFSSTLRNDVLCRVSGSFNRVVKIVF